MFYAGIASNEHELFARLLSVCTGAPLVGRYSYAGTGDGLLENLHLERGHYDTLIELECTVANTNQAEFSVTVGGSTELSALTNEPYTFEGTTFMITMGDTPYIVGDKFTIAAQGEETFTNGTPEFYFSTRPSGVEEDITIECTTASVADADAEFSVTGSVTGSMGTHTQGEDFENTMLRFTTFEGFDFEIGDRWILPLRASPVPANYQWEVLDEEKEVFSNDEAESDRLQTRRVALRGKGNAGTENIYVGLNRLGVFGVEDTWSFTGYSGWDDENIDHSTNLGFVEQEEQPIIVLPQTDLTYYVSITGRRIMGAIVSGSVVQHFYLGFLMQHQAPTYEPYPLLIGGSNVYQSLTLSVVESHAELTTALHTAYFDPCVYSSVTPNTSQVLLYTGNDTHKKLFSGYVNSLSDTTLDDYVYENNENVVFPSGIRAMARLRANFDGTFTPIPMWVARTTKTNNTVKGRLDGIYAVSGDNGQQAGNVFVFDDRYHIVFNNVWRTQLEDFCAIEVK